ncbi:MAG TPA: hypothetical protein VIK13_10680, partial [Candidatus Limnocylindrales bacterium]
PGQAASLRPAGWRRVLAPFAGPRFAFAAPLGSGLAALGIVGILLTGLPLGGATSAVAPVEAERATSSGTGAAPVLAAAAPSAAAAAAPSPGDMVLTQGTSAAPGAPDASAGPALALGPADQPAPGAGLGGAAAKGDDGSTSPVALVVSVVGLTAGLVLLALRFAGRSAKRAP